MTTYYAQYQIPETSTFPVTITEWNPIIPNIYAPPIQHLPIVILPPQIIAPLCPYTGALVPTVHTNTIVAEVPPLTCLNLCNQIHLTQTNYIEESVSSSIEILNGEAEYVNDKDVSEQLTIEEITDKAEAKNSLEEKSFVESFLKLPKELFPTAKMLSIDPNPIINEFCIIANISENISWILDLEFGIPRTPVTRAVATYNVIFNSVHCKNTPNAIHPGFEKCSTDFKRVILFYYDCIVSNWYNGYITMNCDESIENFQSWLLIPMQIFGMCWP